MARRQRICRVVILHACAGETREGYYQPLEQAEIVRQGKDVTILCYSRMRYVVMQAVAAVEKEGYDPEVRLKLACLQRSLQTHPIDVQVQRQRQHQEFAAVSCSTDAVSISLLASSMQAARQACWM